MTLLPEAVIPARGQAGARRAGRRELGLVSGDGGMLDYHSTLVLSPERSQENAMTLGNAARDDTAGECFDGTARGEFLIQRCFVCGRHSGPFRRAAREM